MNQFSVFENRSVKRLLRIRLSWLGDKPVVETGKNALLVLSCGSVALLEFLSQVMLDQGRDLQKVNLQARCMLEVFFPCLRNFLSEISSRKRFHAGAEESLAAKKGGFRLAMREHDHVTVVDPVRLDSMLILCLVD